MRLFKFLNSATQSLTTDTGFAHLKELASLGTELKDIGLDRIKFITVPNEPWPQDNNRLVWTSEANDLWKRIRNDQALGPYESTALSAGTDAGGKPTAKPSPSASASGSPSGKPSGKPSKSAGPTDAERSAAAAEAGLCA